ncbi:hypothetical protein AAHA92_30442 [Salvia divinorum]
MHRNLRASGLKVKHIVRILLLVAFCVWLLRNVQHMKGDEKVGRKQLRPRVDGVERGEDGGEKVEVAENGERDGEETDEWEKERSGMVRVEVEVERDQMQDFIDEDDND